MKVESITAFGTLNFKKKRFFLKMFFQENSQNAALLSVIIDQSIHKWLIAKATIKNCFENLVVLKARQRF